MGLFLGLFAGCAGGALFIQYLAYLTYSNRTQ